MTHPYDLSEQTQAKQILSFNLGSEAYGISIDSVREVLEYTSITRIPKTPEFMRGVINIRGSVVPVIDLRLEFGMPSVEPTIATSIIITEVRCEERISLIGVLVDSVQQVLDLPVESLAEAPPMGNRIRTDFIAHVARVDDSFLIVLDMDSVLSKEQLQDVARNAEPVETDRIAEPA
ncbi:chemotaxis protein CheW [Abyssibacter profundi]|uniref:Chemotaxis protein CheW n=1 Tax=Abyssibacter profundi TaxID=2182787 RepID=A0A363ULN3_9GAMM|nr:chemotaxis protein CheW [Abyssibacter profundi]MBV61990.1 chemotaxis protein CheW [Nevskiales bacterium]PWN56314.1 chemotaxis protein CheW [Abyssibacter profundi]